jgi:hypothetical protein
MPDDDNIDLQRHGWPGAANEKTMRLVGLGAARHKSARASTFAVRRRYAAITLMRPARERGLRRMTISTS